MLKNVVFLHRKVFISVNFSIVSYKQEMRKSLLMKNQKLKEKVFFKNIDILFILDQTKLLNDKNNDYP